MMYNSLLTHVNALTHTNTFAIVDSCVDRVIVVDPGISSYNFIASLIREYDIHNFDVLLTHHHFDHVGGIQYFNLFQQSTFKIFSSSVCSRLMQHPKTNLSSFHHTVKDIWISGSDVIFPYSVNRINLSPFVIDIFPTPGHTSGCLSYKVGDFIFVGDLMIPHARTVTKLPTGDIGQARASIDFVLNYARDDKLTICPGHGLLYQAGLLDVSDFLNA